MTDTYMLDQARQDLANVEADRDRARTIAVHLEQEVAHLAAEHDRALRAANVYGSVIEQVGLLQEHYAIDTERITNLADLLWWSGHLMGKSWITATDWPDLIKTESERAAGGHHD